MEGLEISILNLNEVLKENIDFRLDSGYFSKKYLKFDTFLEDKKSDKISYYAKVSDGDHSKFPDNQKDEVRYLQAKDIKNHFIEDYNPAFVSRDYFEKNKRSHVTEENVILSIMGSVGDIAITPKGFKSTLANRAVAIIRDIKELNPYYLFTYLSTKFGQLQIDRQKNGGVQVRINLDVLAKVKIPFVKKDFQTKIEEIVKNGHFKKNNSRQTYAYAESYLLKEIGLQNFEPSKEPVNIKSFKESFEITGRLDAEYYQKKYELLEDVFIRYKYGSKRLNECIDEINTGEFAKEYLNKEKGLTFFIRNTNISDGEIIEDENYFVEKKGFTKFTKPGDILTARVGAIGNFGAINDKFKDCIYSDNVLCIRLKEKLNPSVYTCLFNLKIYSFLLEKISGGSVQPLITQTSIKDLLIPIIPFKEQEQIAKLIEESLQLKAESERLMDVAKKAVEIAIEINEEVAMQFIKDNTI